MTAKPESRCFLVSKDVVIPLSSNAAVILGRDPATCNFVLTDERVSRVHAMVFARDGEFFVKDLNSSNGTFVNDQRLDSVATLKPGDIIALSPFRLEFVRPDFSQVIDATDQQPVKPPELRNKLEGSLSTLSITDLIQLLNATLQTGILSITDAEDQDGDLFFADGEIIQAAYDGKIGEEAVYALLRNRKGKFEFTKTEPIPLQRRLRAQPAGGGDLTDDQASRDPDQQIFRKTQSLLLEGMRLLDERHPATAPVNKRADAAGPAEPIDQFGHVSN